jgi:hypothetical protein
MSGETDRCMMVVVLIPKTPRISVGSLPTVQGKLVRPQEAGAVVMAWIAKPGK